MNQFAVGDYVIWKWVGSIAHGTVVSVSAKRTTIESKGSIIVRNGKPDNPAVQITQDNGTLVLKLASELQKAKHVE